MGIWFKPLTLEEITKRQTQWGSNVNDKIGIQITEIGEDFLRGTMPMDHRTSNPHGTMHGGAHCILAETLGSVGAYFCVDPSVAYTVGTELHTTFLRSVTSGMVTGTAKPIHIGRSTQIWEINIEDDQKRLLTVTRLTVFVKSLKQGEKG